MSNSISNDALSIWNAGVDSVRADRLLGRTVSADGNVLRIGDQEFSIDGKIRVVGGGKATAAMAAGLESALGHDFCEQHQLSGWINVPDGTLGPLNYIHGHIARPAGANEPTEAAVNGTQEILKSVSKLETLDLCIALISGGGSALLPAPRMGISLADKLAVTRTLSSAGANIQELNTVRKQLSDIKGGGLLRSCRAGTLVTLIISDVLGDPLDVIASGPTVVDPSSPSDALEVLRRFDPKQELPKSIYSVLQGGAKKDVAEITCESETMVIANNATAVDAAGVRAEQLGFSHAMQSATACEGEAERIGEHLAKMALRMLREPGPDCLISGGEPVVKLAPAELRGLGGRNQQLVLAAMGWLTRYADLTESERSRLVIMSGGTDGEDGPTDAAGAVLNEEVWGRSQESGLDWEDALQRNDAYHFFDACGGLIRTGPTNTNVCDLRVVVIRK